MENRIPIPTDNIYKFYALFSLVLLIFSIGSIIYSGRTSNAEVSQLAPELIRLGHLKNPTSMDKEMKLVLEKRLQVVKVDRQIYFFLLIALTFISTVGMVFGFDRWHKVLQPKQDRLLDLQIRLAELQVRREEAKLRSDDE